MEKPEFVYAVLHERSFGPVFLSESAAEFYLDEMDEMDMGSIEGLWRGIRDGVGGGYPCVEKIPIGDYDYHRDT